jgi:hypothetical protein
MMKKIKLFYLSLIMFSLLFTWTCKDAETFNIVGTWTGSMTWTDSTGLTDTTDVEYTFSGSESSGTVFLDIAFVATLSGTYSISGLNITMNLTWNNGNPATHSQIGSASDDMNTISGTFTQNNGYHGTWTASR